MPKIIQILVNHYNENEEIVKRFLDSLAFQKNASFEVLICSDGGLKISRELFKAYDFPILYAYANHSGVCHTRNILYDKSSADYIMFCDIDDCFSDEHAINLLMRTATLSDADIIGTTYDCEYEDHNKFYYRTLKRDIIRVHGKIFKRKYIEENHIRFPDEMETSGDMMFLWLAYALTNKIIWLNNNIYIWKHQKNSVTRHKEFHKLWSYCKTLKCYDLLSEDLKKRNLISLRCDLIATVFSMMYLDDNDSDRMRGAPDEAIKAQRDAIRKFINRYYSDYKEIPDDCKRDKFNIMFEYKQYKNKSVSFDNIFDWINTYEYVVD